MQAVMDLTAARSNRESAWLGPCELAPDASLLRVWGCAHPKSVRSAGEVGAGCFALAKHLTQTCSSKANNVHH